MQNIEQLQAFVTNTFLFGDTSRQPGPDDSFLEAGIIDSTGVLELVQFIEDTYQVKIADEELVPENLDSLNRLVAFIRSKTAKTAAA